MASAMETLRIAHSAKCKLAMAANSPNRNFRFILGHALTLDKLMLRVAEIETDSDSSDDEDGLPNEEPPGPAGRRVSFSASSRARHATAAAVALGRKTSPPPAGLLHPGEEEEEEDEEEEQEEDLDEEEEGLGLQRFPSASAIPPRNMELEDEGIGIDDEELKENELPSEDELKTITGGQANREMTDMYNSTIRCPCNKNHAKAPKVGKMWDMPGKGPKGGRLAVVSVEA